MLSVHLHIILPFAYIGDAISSSTFEDDRAKWGPQLAIDGQWSEISRDFFSSKSEDFPWLVWHLSSTTKIIGITVSDRNKGSGENLKMVEIRAGKTSVSSRVQGKITDNELCGKFEGPGENNRVYTIMCGNPILAKYISLQILDKNSTLQINELELITDAQGNTLSFVYKILDKVS